MGKYSLFLFFMAMICKLHYSQNISSSTVLSSKTRINTHAVLVIGTHLSSSDDNVVEMNKIGDFFSARGVKVHKFYIQNSRWEDIKRAAKNAHFFVYSGHGSNQGKNGTGGLVLVDYVTNDQIENELELRNNAMVLFQSVCRAAGSSAGDRGDIGVKLAEQRVSDYAEPFIKNGASVYYANNYHEGCLEFLNYFFLGQSVEEAYKKSLYRRLNIEFNKRYMYDPKHNISIASSNPYGTITRTETNWKNGEKVTTTREIPSPKSYSTAFVGKSNFKFINLKNLTL